MKVRKDKQPIWLENRPNRNVKSLDQSLEDGYEKGDNGDFVDELEDKIDTDLLLSQLPEQQKKALQLKLEGYNQEETANIMGISQKSVSVLLKKGGVYFKRKMAIRFPYTRG